jgi:hypothetical protein
VNSAAAFVPIVLIVIAFIGFCLYDLSRTEVRYLPKWAWVIVVLISIPLGGILYLAIGRDTG